MASILLVLPDPDEARILRSRLEASHHSLAVVPSGQACLATLTVSPPDLVVVDWALRDVSAATILRTLSAEPLTRMIPVVAISELAEEVDRIVAFELGVSDYVPRPYSVREVVLRIQAILRRARPDSGKSSLIEVGRLRIDRAAHRVWVDEREIELTLLELNLLLALCEGRSRVQTRATLLEEVWGIDASVTTRTVDTHVKRLRDKLGPVGEYIETVRGIGYRFVDLGSSDSERQSSALRAYAD